jgi:hypothetical protein
MTVVLLLEALRPPHEWSAFRRTWNAYLPCPTETGRNEKVRIKGKVKINIIM